MLAVGNCCYVAVRSAVQSASAPTGGGEGWGHIVAAARLQLVKTSKRFWDAIKFLIAIDFLNHD